MRFLSVLFALAFILSSCQNPTDTVQTKTYFDLKGFIEQQIIELNKRKPLVNKKMTMDNNKDSKETTQIDWAKELELFIQGDLNKQAYQLSYTISHPTPNTHLYSLKSEEKLPVKSLKVVINETSKQPSLVEILLEEKNKLYHSQKRLLLTCTMRPEGVWLLKTYEISGFQQLTLTDKKIFNINAIVK